LFFFLSKIALKTNSAAKMKGLKGKVAIVTASTDGIGYAIAERLLEEGAKVVVSSRKQPNIDKAVSQLKEKGFTDLIGVACHVGNNGQIKELIQKTVAKFGHIDILISNAAVSPAPSLILDMEEEQWDKIFAINVKSAWVLAKEAKPFFNKNANILFVSSIAGFTPSPPLGLYGVSKTTLFGLTKSLALELGPENIRVNCLAPGTIETRFSELLWKGPAAQNLLKNTPIGRFGKSSEMASVAAFLVSEESTYITGEIIVAAGGLPSRL